MELSFEKIVDIHTHILPGIDDGPQTIEQSLALANCYARLGIRKIVCTSHFIPGSAWAVSKDVVLQKIAALQAALDENGIALDLYPGMEIAMHKKLRERLGNGLLLPLGTSPLFLIEPSFSESADMLLNIFEELSSEGYRCIVAHPERIPALQEMGDSFSTFLRENAIQVQLNIGSLLGRFGKESLRCALQLIAGGDVHYLASDAHGAETRKPPDETEWLELVKIIGQDAFERLCCNQPGELVSGKVV